MAALSKQSKSVGTTVSHGNFSFKISTIGESPSDAGHPTSTEEMAALTTFLDFFCRQEKRDTWAVKMARALATTALERVQSGKPRIELNSAYVVEILRQDIAPESATGWLSGIWTTLKTRLDQREAGMQDTARRDGLAFYAWPRKIGSGGGAGNSSTYTMELIRLAEAEGLSVPLPPGGIAYVRDVTLRPAFWVHRVVAAGFALKGWRRNLFLAYGLGGPALVGCWLLVLWLIITTRMTRLTTGELSTLVLLAGMVAWLGYIFLRPFWTLIDRRIIMAPDALVSLRERGVQLEAAKETSDDGQSVRIIRLVRYSGRCPICSDDVHLHDGGKEFPGRLIGRCDEHPAEHVYSFDRHTRVGHFLR